MATVLITGANRGIGLALAKAYARDGDTVIATCRSPGEADELRATGAEIHELEVTSQASVNALVETLDGRGIDLLIHNAGVGDRRAFGDLDYADFARVLEINTIAPLRVIEALWPNVKAGKGRMIAAMSSKMGSIESTNSHGAVAYRTSKAGLNIALRSAAVRLAEEGITLLALHPGWVKTDMGGAQAPVSPDESARGLKTVMAEAGAAAELRFFDYLGETLPW